MLTESEIALVCSGRHGDPFAVLGVHAWQGQSWLRAMLPGASQVVALDARSGELLNVLERRHADGLFEAVLPPDAAANYRLQIRWSDGSSTIADDPYRYGPVLAEDELAQHAQGNHLRPSELLGALPRVLDHVAGTAFAVWAPNASRVSLVGDFNHWDGRTHGMRQRIGHGVWEIFLPGVGLGAHYKFEIRSHAGRVLPAKSDPYALQCEAPPGTNSISARLPPVRPAAADTSREQLRGTAMAIYEVHLGSWRRASGAAGRGRPPSWDDLAQTLAPYASGLGFTHLELLPVGEHPFDGSWGYQQIGMYAPTARFGDAAGFGRFVERCHAEGLKVLIQWVPSHFPGDPHGLARFDGSRLYEGADAEPENAADWNTLSFNAARPEVRNFLVGNALFWLERYGVDGLSVASAPSGSDDAAARALRVEVQRQLARLRPQALTVDRPATEASVASSSDVDFGRDPAWAAATLRYMARDPAQRAAHPQEMSAQGAPGRRVVLALGHEHVLPDQGSLLARMPGTRDERYAQLRAYLAFLYAHPGRKLLFMGNEFAHVREWQHEQGLDWSLLDDPAHLGVQRLVGDLNRLLRATPALYERDFEPAGIEWIEPGDGRRAVLSFLRRGHASDARLLTVCNFDAVSQPQLRIGVAQPGSYALRLDTDHALYGGATAHAVATHSSEPWAAHGHAHSISISVPAYATVMLAWQAA
ncbi:MAG: alpha amylase C-terminal domain-containing protein [Burkholderiaceae bacterium]